MLRLAELFDKLEKEARRLGGADMAKNVFGSELAKELTGKKDVKEGVIGLFNTVIEEMDYEIARVLDIEPLVESIRTMILELARRRLSRTMESKHRILKGSEELFIKPKGKAREKRRKESKVSTDTKRLTDFI